MGTVYFIATADMAAVKIGYTSGDPYVRMRQLQIGNPKKLIMIQFERGTREDEKIYHGCLADQRLSGEWFAIKGELRESLKGMRDFNYDAELAAWCGQ